MTDYGYKVEVADGYDEAVIRTRLALKGQGFGIISEMHVGGLLGPDAGDDRQYLIMGAWNAPAAQRSVSSDLKVAVHLPCNVVVQETGTSAIVAALDPADAIGPEASIPPDVADEARAALTRALATVADPEGLAS